VTIGSWLAASTAQLEKEGIGTARLDCLVLLEDMLKTDRANLLAHTEIELSSEQQTQLDQQIEKRCQHEPLAYIRQKSEFYGRQFYIDYRVLEPRPESETMIDALLALPLAKQPMIIDIGTGSGALAITAKLELPRAEVIATDINDSSLAVAKQNAKKYNVDIEFIKGDLLLPLYAHHDLKACVLLCNLPYVPNSFQINPAAMREPHIAIYGGEDGLDLYRNLFKQIDPLGNKPIYVLTECLPPQQAMLTEIAKAHNYGLRATDDFIQLFAL